MAFYGQTYSEPRPSSGVNSEMIVRNTFIELQDPDAVPRQGRRLKTVPATPSMVAEEPEDVPARSVPVAFFGRASSPAAPSMPMTNATLTSMGPTVLSSPSLAVSGGMAAAASSSLTFPGGMAAAASPSLAVSGGLAATAGQAAAGPIASVGAGAIRSPIPSPIPSARSPAVSPATRMRSMGPTEAARAAPTWHAVRQAQSSVSSMGPAAMSSSVTSMGPAAMSSSVTSMGPAAISSARLLPAQAASSPRLQTLTAPSVPHSLSAPTKVSVRNTFIEVDNPELLQRDSRRLKTVPPTSTAVEAFPEGKPDEDIPSFSAPPSAFFPRPAAIRAVSPASISSSGQLSSKKSSPTLALVSPTSSVNRNVSNRSLGNSMLGSPISTATRSIGSQLTTSAGPTLFPPTPSGLTPAVRHGSSGPLKLGGWPAEMGNATRSTASVTFASPVASSAAPVAAAPVAAAPFAVAPVASLPSGALDAIKAGATVRTESPTLSPPTIKHASISSSSSHLGSNVVVRNTFIDLEEAEGLNAASRSGRRVKTLPATPTPVAYCEDDDEEQVAAAASMPLGDFARPMPAVRWQQASPIAVPQQSSSPGPPPSVQGVVPGIVKPSYAQGYPTATVSMAPGIMQPLQPPPGVFAASPVRSVMIPSVAASGGQATFTAAKVITPVDGRSLRGQVWALSQDATGCRQVQQALDTSDDDLRLAIAAELRGHVNEALHSPHANFVVRKCVERIPAPALQFVIDELLGAGRSAICEAARHRYGCRIIESLFQYCTQAQLQQVGELLLADASGLCAHMYGNFVMQKMLEYGTEQQKKCIVQALINDVTTLGTSFYASAVYGTAFKVAGLSAEDKTLLSHTLVDAPNVLATMSRFKHGPEIVDLSLNYVDGLQAEAVRASLAIAQQQRQQAAAQAAAQAQQPKVARTLSGDRGKKQRHSANANQPRIVRIARSL